MKLEDRKMKKILLVSLVALAATAGGASAQMMGGQHMMGTSQQPQPQAQLQPGGLTNFGMMGYGMYPGMTGGYGMQWPMMGYGMGNMYPGMMGGYGTTPGMMGGYGMHQPMMGYGTGYGMHPGMMGYGTAPCLSGHGMHQPMMDYGMHLGMTGYGMPHKYPGAGGDVEKQREFMKETFKLRKKLHDLMFDCMEARWNPDMKPEQLEKFNEKMQGLQQELYEKSRELLR